MSSVRRFQLKRDFLGERLRQIEEFLLIEYTRAQPALVEMLIHGLTASGRFLFMRTTVHNCSLNYHVVGEGMPILFLHGYRVDKTSLQIFFEDYQYPNEFKRIYLDLPGMGRSTASISILNSNDMLNCLDAFIQEVIGNDEYVMVAQSYGGYLAQGLLKLRHSQIKGLFLLAPVVKALSTERSLPVKPQLVVSGYEKVPTGGNIEGFLENNVHISPENWSRYQLEILAGLQLGQCDFLNSLEVTGYKLDFEHQLSEIVFHKPAYVLLGKQDQIVGYSDMFFFLSNYTACNFHVIFNAGHNIQIDQPILVYALFSQFLSEV